MNKLFLMCALLLVVGCGGGPTLDASSEESLKSSMEAMAKNLSEEDQKKFTGYLQLVGRSKQLVAAGSGKELPLHEALKDSHGLTASQIIAKREATLKRLKTHTATTP